MRLLIVTIGSLGDVLPFLSIAVDMQRRGHAVELCTNPRAAELVEAAGIAFHPVGSVADADRAQCHADLWHPIRGFGVLWRYLAAPALRPTFDRIGWHVANGEGPLTVLASPLALGARVAREKWAFKLITAYTSPMNIRSVDDPMFLGSWRVPTWVPNAWRWGLWRGLDAWKLHPLVRPTLLRWREELALPEITQSVFGDWMHGGDRRIALFPRWFGEVRSKAGVIEHCDFPYWDTQTSLDDEIERFLSSGTAPVVIYPGSGARWIRPFVELGLQVSRLLGRRAIILTPQAAELPELDSVTEIHRSQLAFDRLLPSAQIVIHHGGVGTCAQALRAGCMQVILPSAYDQFDNGERIRSLGGGESFVHWQAKTSIANDIVYTVQRLLRESFSAAGHEMSCSATELLED